MASGKASAMFTRTAVTGLLVAVATAIFPAVAAATIAPVLTLNQSAGTTAGSNAPTGFDINLKPLFADSLKDLAISFPPGFMVNLQTDGGACLSSSTPTPTCRIGSGTINGPFGTPVNLYLVAPPIIGDIAGVALVIEGGATRTADLTLETTPDVGLNMSFRFLPPGIGELQFTLASPRLPTRCASEQDVAVEAASWQGSSESTTSPLSVSGCSSLPYAPTLAATAIKENGSEAQIVVTFTQGAGESATSSLAFGIPSGMKLNRVLAPCLEGSKCSVGTVSATSPLLPPAALGSGALTLSGSLSGPALNAAPAGVALTMAFPAPYPFLLVGPINLSERLITFSNLPDIPLSTITFTFAGTPQGAAFTTECERGSIAGTFIPWDGAAAVKQLGVLTNVGCPPPAARPTATGSLSGLAGRTPVLHLRARRGGDAPDIASLSIELPAGLSFGREALVRSRVCSGGSGQQSKCTTRISVKGLSLSGTGVRSAQIQGRELWIRFTRDTPAVSLTAGAPLLSESSALAGKAKQHDAGTLLARLGITDSAGTGTVVRVP